MYDVISLTLTILSLSVIHSVADMKLPTAECHSTSSYIYATN